jgi:hypothetical protein
VTAYIHALTIPLANINTRSSTNTLTFTMPFSNYSYEFDVNYPPTQDIIAFQDPFDKTYSADPGATSLDYPLSTFFDTDSFFDQPLSSVEMASSKASDTPTLPVTGISAADDQHGYGQTYFQAPFTHMDYVPGCSLDPTFMNPIKPAPSSSTSQSSRASSLCGDTQEQTYSPSLSPRLIKHESPMSPVLPREQTTPKRQLRKRGRPRLDRVETHSQSNGSSSAKIQRTGRLPHNQVERKYREGLNTELERLRKAVPTLPHSEEGDAMGQPKPSKAMVLSSAIDYIKRIEREKEALKEEVERLKRNQGQNMVWTSGNASLDEFLMDS